MPAFSLSSFILFKRLFSSSSLFASRVVSSAYLTMLIFLLTILILVFDSSSPAFHMMYTSCKLNKQDNNIQPCHTPSPILNQFIFLDTNSLPYMICNFFFLLCSLSSLSGKFILMKSKVIYWRRQWHPTPVLLPGKSHGWRSLGGYSPWGRYEWDMTERLHFHLSLSHIGKGNGNPLQCSCLENPRDGGAWWATVYGVAQSQTQLK